LIYANVLEILTTSRREAFVQIAGLKDKYKIEIDRVYENSRSNQETLLIKTQKEKTQLEQLIIKMKAYDELKMNYMRNNFSKKLTEVTDNSNKIKRQEIDNTLLSEQRQLLLNQQKTALKKRLVKLDVDFNNLKSVLEKEVSSLSSFFFNLYSDYSKFSTFIKLKEQANKEHELQQRIKNEKNLNSAKQSNVEKLVYKFINFRNFKKLTFTFLNHFKFEELEAKEIELRNLHLITEKAAKIQMVNENKIAREISSLKKTMIREQNLKLDAFQRVDELQTNVYSLEDDIKVLISSRPPSAANKCKLKFQI
jgi:hypothetical protein